MRKMIMTWLLITLLVTMSVPLAFAAPVDDALAELGAELGKKPAFLSTVNIEIANRILTLGPNDLQRSIANHALVFAEFRSTGRVVADTFDVTFDLAQANLLSAIRLSGTDPSEAQAKLSRVRDLLESTLSDYDEKDKQRLRGLLDQLTPVATTLSTSEVGNIDLEWVYWLDRYSQLRTVAVRNSGLSLLTGRNPFYTGSAWSAFSYDERTAAVRAGSLSTQSSDDSR